MAAVFIRFGRYVRFLEVTYFVVWVYIPVPVVHTC